MTAFDPQKISAYIKEQIRWQCQRYAVGPSVVTSFDPNTTQPTLEATSYGQVVNPARPIRGGSLFMSSGHSGDIGTGSWIRTAPFPGTAVLTAKGYDNNVYAIGYSPSPTWATKASQSYIEGKGLWRPMVSGDIDIRTTGNAGAFFTQQGTAEIRGGLVRHLMNGVDGTNEMRAATHVIAGPNNSIENEKLFGVADGIYVGVQRRFLSPTDRLPVPLPSSSFISGGALRPLLPNVLAIWSKTLSASLLDGQGSPLYRGRVADYVASTLGIPEPGVFGPYRAIYEWWADCNPFLPALTVGIASGTGDVDITSITPNPAGGWNLKLSPPGSVSWITGVNLSLKGTGALSANYPISMSFSTGGTFTATAVTGITFTGATFSVKSGKISLGLSPVQGGIVTDKTHPVDFMTGWPIVGLPFIKAG